MSLKLIFASNIYRNLVLVSCIYMFFCCCCFSSDKDLFLLNSNSSVIYNCSDFSIDFFSGNLFSSNKSKYPVIEFNDGKNLRYYFYTSNIVNIPAYSTKPLELLIGLNINGIIEDISLIKHSEPILLTGISLFELYDAVNFYKNKDIKDLSFLEKDIITGATVTSCILNETILGSSKIIASELGIISFNSFSKKNLIQEYKNLSWNELINSKAIAHYELYLNDEKPLIDLYYTIINPCLIGKNLFVSEEYDRLINNVGKNDLYLLLLNNGSWSFKGSAFTRGGIYDRFKISQSNTDVRFMYCDYVDVNIYKFKEDVPYFYELGLFVIKNNDFSVTEQWRLELLLANEVDNVKNFITLFANYEIPSKFLESEYLKYKKIWINNFFEIFLYVFLWIFVICLFIFRKFFVTKYILLNRIKIFIYIISIFYFGFFCSAQPSIVNIFAIINKNMSVFLFSPLLFIGWVMMFFTLLLWGRGFFCGWICPFGALQELLFKIRVALTKYKNSFEISNNIHFYFKMFRYYVFMFLIFIFFFYSPEAAEVFAEVEPFKTVLNIGILKRMEHEYEFVVYSLILLLVSIFIYRFFCRYICPLGAFLSLLSKFSLIKIKRRKTCNFCKICSKSCESRAINLKGEINVFECLACFNCIKNMYDNRICPPLLNNKVWIKYEI